MGEQAVTTLYLQFFLTNRFVRCTVSGMPKANSTKTSTKAVRTTVAAKVSHATATITPSHEDISRRAYEIYEREGRPDGRELAHWAQAETELLGL